MLLCVLILYCALGVYASCVLVFRVSGFELARKSFSDSRDGFLCGLLSCVHRFYSVIINVKHNKSFLTNKDNISGSCWWNVGGLIVQN